MAQLELEMEDDDGPSYDGVTAAQVKAYLKAHPDFLDMHPDLLRVLTPPEFHDGDKVVDMQRFMMERLKQQIEGQQKEFTDLIFSARDNLSVQTQIHEAVLRLLESESFDGLMHVIATDLQRIFAVDVVKLCVEAEVAPFRDREYASLQFVPKGTVDKLMGQEMVVLDSKPMKFEHVFGGETGLVASYALVRMHFSEAGAPGMIAFGVRNKDQFHAGQGTEFLRFLGQVLEHCVSRLWAPPPGEKSA